MGADPEDLFRGWVQHCVLAREPQQKQRCDVEHIL
jgi:hypothetical protein